MLRDSKLHDESILILYTCISFGMFSVGSTQLKLAVMKVSSNSMALQHHSVNVSGDDLDFFWRLLQIRLFTSMFTLCYFIKNQPKKQLIKNKI